MSDKYVRADLLVLVFTMIVDQIAYPEAILDQIKGKHMHVCEVMTCVCDLFG